MYNQLQYNSLLLTHGFRIHWFIFAYWVDLCLDIPLKLLMGEGVH